MRIPIFYSWQSDLPGSTNRNFIERALEDAIGLLHADAEIQAAIREDELVVDRDTKGLSGTPPIVDSIFDKITRAAVFVPDLTFIARSDTGRAVPNPNVLIEYGWALKSLGHGKLIPVMNEAYGEPNASSLPFDMRHLRHPLTYNLNKDSDASTIAKERANFARDLANAISLIVTNTTLPASAEAFAETIETTDPSTYLEPDETFTTENRQTFRLPLGERLYLRLMPARKIDRTETSKELLRLMRDGGLRAMSADHASGQIGRNTHGAFIVDTQGDQRVLTLTQIFKTLELWGIDGYLFSRADHALHSPDGNGYFPCHALESRFEKALANYLSFAKATLQLEAPFNLRCGATGVLNYRMTAPEGTHFGGFERFAGRVAEANIQWETTIRSSQETAYQILEPFFEHLWNECGLDRSAQHMRR